MIRAILFDFGNVLAFFDHHRATRRFAKKSAFSEQQIYDLIYDNPFENSFEEGAMSAHAFLERVVELIGYRGTITELQEEFVDIFSPNSPVLHVIPRLATQFRLVLASNTNVLHSNHFRQQYADTLRHFHGLGMSWQCGVRKPQRRFFDYCLGLAGCRPSECIFVDDMPVNTAGAVAAGIRSILYNDHCKLIGELERYSMMKLASE